MQNFDIVDNFGVTAILLDCAFSAELKRDTIGEIMNDIDSQLTEQGAPEDNETRIELIMDNVATLSAMVANEEIGHDDGVADIAYSFIYVLGKTLGGFEQLVNLRGMTGTFLKNVLSLSPCLGETDFQQETASLARVMADEDWDPDSQIPPTIH